MQGGKKKDICNFCKNNISHLNLLVFCLLNEYYQSNHSSSYWPHPIGNEKSKVSKFMNCLMILLQSAKLVICGSLMGVFSNT